MNQNSTQQSTRRKGYRQLPPPCCSAGACWNHGDRSAVEGPDLFRRSGATAAFSVVPHLTKTLEQTSLGSADADADDCYDGDGAV